MTTPHGPPPDPAGASDDDLLRAFAATRSADAFARIVGRHGPMVHRTCQRLLGNAHDAEDAAQAVFLVLARRPGAARHSLAGWLHGTARNTARQMARQRARRGRREKATAPVSEAPPPDDGRLREEIDAALGDLPPHLQEAVVMCHLEGHGQKEAARVLGCHQGTLSRRVAEGLSRLRAVLLRRGVGVTPAVLLGFLTREAAAATVPASLLTAAPALAAGAAATGGAAALADGVAKAVFWAKAKLFAAVTAAVAVPVAVTVPLVVNRPDPVPTGPATALAVSADGKLLAAAGPDHAVRLSDVATGQERAALKGHTGRVGVLAFATDGRWVASGGDGGEVVLWDVATGTVRAQPPPLPAPAAALAFAPDGGSLVYAAQNGTVRRWDVAAGEGRVLYQPPDPKSVNPSTRVTVAPDGRAVAANALTGRWTVDVWDVGTGEKRPSLDHGRRVVQYYDLAFAARARTLAAAGVVRESHQGVTQSTAVVVCWADLGKPPVVMGGDRGRIASWVRVAPDGKTVVWAETPLQGSGTRVKTSDLARKKHHPPLDLDGNPHLELLADGKTLASVAGDRSVRLHPLP